MAEADLAHYPLMSTADERTPVIEPRPGNDTAPAASSVDTPVISKEPSVPVREIGGREGPEPTRFGDWEKNGRCIDF